jgi:hypothetical protein
MNEPLGRTVELQIDELVLDGFPRERANAIGDAVQQELTRRLEIDTMDFADGGASVAALVQETLAGLVRKIGP